MMKLHRSSCIRSVRALPTAIGLAIEGQLSLDDPAFILPDDTPTEPGWQLEAMRIRDLITMTTGTAGSLGFSMSSLIG